MKLYKDLTDKDEGYTCCLICNPQGFPEDDDEEYDRLEAKLKREPTSEEMDKAYQEERAKWEMYEDRNEWFEHLSKHTKKEILSYFGERFENGTLVEHNNE